MVEVCYCRIGDMRPQPIAYTLVRSALGCHVEQLCGLTLAGICVRMQIDTPLTCKKYVLDNYHYQNTIFPLAFQGVLFYFPSNTPKSGCLSLAGSDENGVFWVLQNRKIPPILSSKEKSRLFGRLFRFLVQEFSKNLAPLSGLVRPPVRAGRQQPQRPNRIARTPAQGGNRSTRLARVPLCRMGPARAFASECAA